jgi:hypothetical protein
MRIITAHELEKLAEYYRIKGDEQSAQMYVDEESELQREMDRD